MRGRFVQALLIGIANVCVAFACGPAAAEPVGWGPGTLLEHNDTGIAYNARVATNGDGRAMFTWVQNTGAVDAIHARTYDPSFGWGETSLIQTDLSAPGDQAIPVIDAAGNAVVSWIGYATPQQVWVARYNASSGWSPAVRIDTGADNADRSRPAIDAAGNVMVVWQQSDGIRNDIWASRYTVGTGWGTPTRIEASDGGSIQVSVSSDSAGDVVAIWAQTDAGVRKATVNRFVPGTGWATATQVETGGAGNATSPRVAMTPDGRAVAIWSKSDGTRISAWSSFFTPSGGWTSPALMETDDATDANATGVAVDGSGRALATFLRCGTQCAPWAARSSSWGAWEAPIAIAGPGAGGTGPAFVAMNERGDGAAIWPQETGGHSDIWATLYTPAGGWSTSARIETDNRGEANTPWIALDQRGNAYAAWDDYDGTNASVWANFYRAPVPPDRTMQDRIDALEDRLAEQDLALQKAGNDLDSTNQTIVSLTGQLATLTLLAVVGLFAGIAGIGMALVVWNRASRKAADAPSGTPAREPERKA